MCSKTTLILWRLRCTDQIQLSRGLTICRSSTLLTVYRKLLRVMSISSDDKGIFVAKVLQESPYIWLGTDTTCVFSVLEYLRYYSIGFILSTGGSCPYRSGKFPLFGSSLLGTYTPSTAKGDSDLTACVHA